MTRQEIEERAFSLHQNGWHCAEAVLTAALEAFQPMPETWPPRLAACFGGGVGRTHEELCGALAGGLIALGCLHGRDAPGGNWDKAARLAAQLRERFLALHGTCRCADILAAFGEQENMHKCKRLSGVTAGLLHALLKEAAPPA
jgi:C_GCAxxG_C_C family probable redox protein